MRNCDLIACIELAMESHSKFISIAKAVREEEYMPIRQVVTETAWGLKQLADSGNVKAATLFADYKEHYA